MDTDYTFAATDLAHTSADIMRYCATVIQAIEAPTKEDFLQVARSLPDQRARIEQNLARYATTTAQILGSHEALGEHFQDVKARLDAYVVSANHTMDLLTRLWAARSDGEAAALRSEAELHAAIEAGPRLIEVSLALDQFMERVTAVAQHIREEKARSLRTTSAMLLVGGLLLGVLNLFLGRTRHAGTG